ncbi:MAG: hypothetical protein LBH43_09345 [Treponema sp.]|nr:hypothetical protein [Treponema sp.]
MAFEKLRNSRTFPTLCKHCGEKVFYYSNDYGSKVFFDHLGGNWPIHECIKIVKAYRPKAILIKKNFLRELVDLHEQKRVI